MYKKKKKKKKKKNTHTHTQKTFQSSLPINQFTKLCFIPLKYLLPFRKFLNKQK